MIDRIVILSNVATIGLTKKDNEIYQKLIIKQNGEISFSSKIVRDLFGEEIPGRNITISIEPKITK